MSHGTRCSVGQETVGPRALLLNFPVVPGKEQGEQGADGVDKEGKGEGRSFGDPLGRKVFEKRAYALLHESPAYERKHVYEAADSA